MSSSNPQGMSSRELRGTANRLLREMDHDIKEYVGHCLFVVNDNGDYCNESVTNNCHIVSETAVLHKLREHGEQEVLVLGWGVSEWRKLLFGEDVEERLRDLATFAPSPKPTHDSCFSRFACKAKAHDDKFQCIDVAEPDFGDPLVCFLSAYRLVLYRADQYHQALNLYAQWNEAALSGPLPEGIPWWLQHGDRLEKEHQEAQEKAALLGRNWFARETGVEFDADLVSAAEVLTFRSKLMLAGGVFYGKHTLVTVFPTGSDWHILAILYLTSESEFAKKEIQILAHVAEASRKRDNYGVIVTRALLTNGWGDLAVSQKSYDELSKKDRSKINGLVARQAHPGAASRAGRRQLQSGRRPPPERGYQKLRAKWR